MAYPGLSLRSNPGLELANAFGVFVYKFKLTHDFELLLRRKPKEKTLTVWYADRCEKSKPLPGFDTHHVNDAADDLAYLEKMDKVTGKTRISGTLISYQSSPIHNRTDVKKLAGTKVRLIGEEKTYETVTNEDGVYEIYDLLAGRYTVEPTTPKGWAIDKPSAYSGGGSGSREDTKHFQLTLEKGRHADFDFLFKVDTRIRGRVLNRFGIPMNSVCVNLIPLRARSRKISRGLVAHGREFLKSKKSRLGVTSSSSTQPTR